MEWPKVLGLILAAMLLLYFAPGLVGAVVGSMGLILGALMTLFVFGDARERGMETPAVLVWSGLTFFSAMYTCQYSLVVLLLYLIVTRGRW